MTRDERMNPDRCGNQIQRNHIINIEKYGVSLIVVLEDGEANTPTWAYTIGFWQQYGHPEVLITGLTAGLVKILLNNLDVSIRDEGRRFEDGSSFDDIIDGYVCYFQQVHHSQPGDWMAGDRWFYGGDDYPCVQMIWPNTSGIYPWDGAADAYLKWDLPLICSLPGPAVN